jgi:hypothetical protein
MSMGMGIDAAELYGQHRRENWKLRGRETTERQAPDLTEPPAWMMDHRDVELPVRVSLRAIMSKTQPNHCSHLHIVFVREALPEVTEQVIGTARSADLREHHGPLPVDGRGDGRYGAHARQLGQRDQEPCGIYQVFGALVRTLQVHEGARFEPMVLTVFDHSSQGLRLQATEGSTCESRSRSPTGTNSRTNTRTASLCSLRMWTALLLANRCAKSTAYRAIPPSRRSRAQAPRAKTILAGARSQLCALTPKAWAHQYPCRSHTRLGSALPACWSSGSLAKLLTFGRAPSMELSTHTRAHATRSGPHSDDDAPLPNPRALEAVIELRKGAVVHASRRIPTHAPRPAPSRRRDECMRV